MAITKKAKPRKPSRPKKLGAKDWRDALRLHLSKVPEVDAVFVRIGESTIHVYSVIDDIHKTNYKRLISREDQIEKAFPDISFEFHGWPHQGRDPREAGPPNCELVYLR
jgi:hypothetical protein